MCYNNKIMKKGFTLIEILVVISIVSTFSSIVMASINIARAKGRDGARTLQVAQIDTAIKLYIEDKGKSPDLEGSCKATTAKPSYDKASKQCFVISTSDTPVQYSGNITSTPWQKFKEDLKPYIADIPNDPCPSCSTTSLYPIGYNYITPVAQQYEDCNADRSCDTPADVEKYNKSYQVYATLENKVDPVGADQNTGGTVSKSFSQKAPVSPKDNSPAPTPTPSPPPAPDGGHERYPYPYPPAS